MARRATCGRIRCLRHKAVTEKELWVITRAMSREFFRLIADNYEPWELNALENWARNGL